MVGRVLEVLIQVHYGGGGAIFIAHNHDIQQGYNMSLDVSVDRIDVGYHLINPCYITDFNAKFMVTVLRVKGPATDTEEGAL